jgi:hypothetical protein
MGEKERNRFILNRRGRVGRLDFDGVNPLLGTLEGVVGPEHLDCFGPKWHSLHSPFIRF